MRISTIIEDLKEQILDLEKDITKTRKVIKEAEAYIEKAQGTIWELAFKNDLKEIKRNHTKQKIMLEKGNTVLRRMLVLQNSIESN